MTAASDRIAETVKLSRPAHQALAAAGIATYADLAKWTRKDVASLHGIGPKTFVFLEPAMNERGVAFKA
jgi:predicted flap endonuclease-1-like 5' DNA nuclease